jgi:acetyltransferase
VKQGVPVFRDTIACVRAIDAAARYAEFLQRPAVATCAPDIDRNAFDTALAAACATPTERTAKAALAAYGLPVTREALARDADEAAHIASSFGGCVALKIESPDIPHKTEAGAIRLGIAGEENVRSAFDAVMAAARAYAPQARLDGVLVQEMIDAGVELMLGIAHDPAFGPVIVVGLGGIHVEVLRDLSYRAAPVDRAEARRMLRELRGYPLLEGVRGQPPCDVDALCATIGRLSWLAVDAADRIAELDVNPLVARPDGVTVVDALIVPRTENRV